MDTGRVPPFALVLGFEYELRKRVFKRVRDDGLTLVDSLKQAESDYEARELHFTAPLANDRGPRGHAGSSGGENAGQSRRRPEAGILAKWSGDHPANESNRKNKKRRGWGNTDAEDAPYNGPNPKQSKGGR